MALSILDIVISLRCAWHGDVCKHDTERCEEEDSLNDCGRSMIAFRGASRWESLDEHG